MLCWRLVVFIVYCLSILVADHHSLYSTTMLSSIYVLPTLLLAASAHQNFHQFWVNGVSPGYQTCIRMPPSNNPVTNVASNDITCNVNGNNVPSGVAVCAAKAGDKIKVQWDSSTHPGPITHMLYGPISDAAQATGIGKWTKINELSYVNNTWANEIMEAQSMTYEFTLPSKLASGDYLLRSEMEALHSSQVIDQTQFYIGCAQLRITGLGGSCSPQITLPGAYKDTDPNIYIPDFYYGFVPATFTAPGGPVATCT
ncbi:glycoside hydrolase family 61 protein [Phlyctema vagabunda]|uniref:AA9 family lytic polysaccharide monooxygenase n=1 Tax=Phlyctema vagabunda TaxID=108571 RepID=A0ABR4PFK3_9HELO